LARPRTLRVKIRKRITRTENQRGKENENKKAGRNLTNSGNLKRKPKTRAEKEEKDYAGSEDGLRIGGAEAKLPRKKVYLLVPPDPVVA
jgi:hypothetical protein